MSTLSFQLGEGTLSQQALRRPGFPARVCANPAALAAFNPPSVPTVHSTFSAYRSIHLQSKALMILLLEVKAATTAVLSLSKGRELGWRSLTIRGMEGSRGHRQ